MIEAARKASFGDMTLLPVTDGTIALLNLQAQIDGLEPDVRRGHATIERRVGLIELITLRGLILGHIADYQRAEEIAEQLVRDVATDGTAFVARARTRAVFHRFTDALDDVDRAERLSVDVETTCRERAAIFQALGRYDEALAIREEAADRRASFENVAALVGLYAERGEIDAAEWMYAESRRRYRGVSPFPTRVGWMMHARHSTLRDAVSRLTRRRKAISPRSKQNWVKSNPQLLACIHWRSLRMILIMLRNSRAFSMMLASPMNPGIGAGWPPRVMTSWSRVTRRPSQTMQPNSGSLPALIRTRRSD